MMQSPSVTKTSKECLHGCCPAPFLNLQEPENKNSKPRNSSAACRQDFRAITKSSILPNTHFTNHESLPSLQDSFTEFTRVFPQYSSTRQVDHIRAKEYYHLSLRNHTCLDYIGTGLFSYSQLQEHDFIRNPAAPPSSSSALPPPLPPPETDFPFFSLLHKKGNLKTHLLHGSQESELESAIKKRIMSFLNISGDDYSMVFTANKTSAFKLLAESYPFQSCNKLLTVYDYQSEAVEAMIYSSEKRGARAMSAEFSWPRLRLNSAKLRKMVVTKRKKKKNRGLFVFPLHSRITGSRYPYIWMSIAQENGWHVLVDACALGPKDMGSFGLSLLRPDFVVCSFFKVFGENPSGFACLFVKKSNLSILEASSSGGLVSIVPPRKLYELHEDLHSNGSGNQVEKNPNNTVFNIGTLKLGSELFSCSSPPSSQKRKSAKSEQGFASRLHLAGTAKQRGTETSKCIQPREPENPNQPQQVDVECRGLDHVDSLGLILLGNRARCLINWLVNAMMKLQHPNSEGASLVRIYGPKVKFDRGPALAFNVFDWKGDKIEPILVQKLADRSNISLSYGFLHHIWFPDKYAAEERFLERKGSEAKKLSKKYKDEMGIKVVTAAMGFLANFEDVYRLWSFVARFLDADFVEKERWRYTTLNRKSVEVL